MKDFLLQLKKEFALLAFLFGFALIPLPGIEGNPTGFQIFHKHSLTRTPVDLALNDKIEIQEIVQSYEYRLNEHIKTLDKIKLNYSNPSDRLIEVEKWKAEKKKIEDKLQDWRQRGSKNRSELKVLLAESS